MISKPDAVSHSVIVISPAELDHKIGKAIVHFENEAESSIKTARRNLVAVRAHHHGRKRRSLVRDDGGTPRRRGAAAWLFGAISAMLATWFLASEKEAAESELDSQ